MILHVNIIVKYIQLLGDWVGFQTDDASKISLEKAGPLKEI